MEEKENTVYTIPPEYSTHFTPNEVEELIEKFQVCDADGSGKVDEEELCGLFKQMNVEISQEDVSKMVETIDKDGNGTLDFQEFVEMMVKARKGDKRFSGLSDIVSSLNSTPVALLQIEAEKLGLTVTYNLIGEIEATTNHGRAYIMECLIEVSSSTVSGMKFEETTIRCEGVSSTTRQAKFNVAKAALLKIKSLKPGMKYDQGVIPPIWEKWLFDNLHRGINALNLLSILREKGFTPAYNIVIMQRLSIQISVILMKSKNKNAGLFKDGGRKLSAVGLKWMKHQLLRGVEGIEILREMERNGFLSSKNPHLEQKLKNNIGSSISHPVNPIYYDFWQSIFEGNLDEVKLFISGGQNPNEVKVDRHSKVVYTPLQLACRHGHLNIAVYLIENGADIAIKNSYNRTALLIAAKHGHDKVVSMLINKGANILDKDNFGNTAVHLSAMGGHVESLNIILNHHENNFRQCLTNVKRLFDETFRRSLYNAFEEIITIKLAENEKRHFKKTWAYDAAVHIFEKISDQYKFLIPPPEKFLVEYTVVRYYKYKEMDNVNYKKTANIGQAIDLQNILETSFRETFINLRNRQGRTALHLACDENQTCSHDACIRSLVDSFGCIVDLKDFSGKFPNEYLLSSSNRPESPSETDAMEKVLQSDRENFRVEAHNNKLNEVLIAKRLAWDSVLSGVIQCLNSLEMFVERIEDSCECRTLLGWREYLDLKTKNRFYQSIRNVKLCQWDMPIEITNYIKKRKIWWKRRSASKILEQIGAWQLHCVNYGEKCIFFYNIDKDEYQGHKPTDMEEKWQTVGEDAFLDPIEETSEDAVDINFEDFENIKEFKNGLVRKIGCWEEHKDLVAGGVCFYNPSTKCTLHHKSEEIILEERTRQAYLYISNRAEELDVYGEWKELFDEETNNLFYFNTTTCEGMLGIDVPKEVQDMKKERKQSKKKKAGVFEANDGKKLAEDKEWFDNLKRARRKEDKSLDSDDSDIEDYEECQRELLDELLENLAYKINEEFLGHDDEEYLCLSTESIQASLRSAFENGLSITSWEFSHSSSQLPNNVDPFTRNEIQSLRNSNITPRTKERRRLAVVLERALWRVSMLKMKVCNWGCKSWFKLGDEKNEHEINLCHRRFVTCRLGCSLVKEKYMWHRNYSIKNATSAMSSTSFMAWHEGNECPYRLIKCPKNCNTWVYFREKDNHVENLCMLRFTPDLFCVFDCGMMFKGGNERIKEQEDEKRSHEEESCELRIVTCTWKGCDDKFQAKEWKAHRKSHIYGTGMELYRSCGNHEYIVPHGVKHVKIQAWGAGGGSGHLMNQKCGHGGGGAFFEGVCIVNPGEILQISVGSGGGKGEYGKLVECDSSETLMTNEIGVGIGGFPGGGNGHGANKEWAVGGGGGYTCITRRTAFGVETIVVIGGGGGGGSRNGIGGGGLERNEDEKVDVRNGRLGNQEKGGEPGKTIGLDSATDEAEHGSAYQGGCGATFGGGGGGGYFGGGGGGFAPGIVGGGGGGSSFVNFKTFSGKPIIKCSNSRMPGGMDHYPPQSVGSADWDIVDGVAGEGALGSKLRTRNGNHGCVRIAKPGFFANIEFGCDSLKTMSNDEIENVDTSDS